MDAFIINILIFIGIYTILTTSLNLSMGYTGLLNLGHIAFFGIGAYTSALLVIAGWPFLGALAASCITAALSGALLMYVVRKLQGDYLALTTLGFSFITYSLFLNWKSLTRGALGLPGIPRPEIFGLLITSNFSYLVLVVIITLLVVFFLHRLIKSRYGTLLEAVRDDEVGLMVFGKHTFKLKRQSMMLSAGIAGIAGALFAHYISFINPSSFYLVNLILIITIVMVGGLASLRGSIVATAIILLIPELLRFIDLPAGMVGPLRQIIYALILIGILLMRPRGIFGRVDLK